MCGYFFHCIFGQKIEKSANQVNARQGWAQNNVFSFRVARRDSTDDRHFSLEELKMLPHNKYQLIKNLNIRENIQICSEYSRVRNKRTPTLINFLTFFQGLRPYSGLHRAYLSSISIRYKQSYAYSFCQIFQRLRLFKGVRLFPTLEQGKPIIYCLGL